MLHIKKGSFALAIIMSSCLSQAGAQNRLTLIHEGNDFRVESDTESHHIQRCYVDKELRGISSDKLAKLTATGAYLKLIRFNESNDYALHLNGRLNGGGIILGNILYWATKGVAYGAPAAIAVSSVAVAAVPLVTVGGTVGAVSAATAASGAAVITGTAGAAVATTAAAGTTMIAAGTTVIGGVAAGGAGAALTGGMIVGEAIVGAVGTNAAAVGAAGVLGAGSSAGYIAAVETASLAAWTIGASCWWLP